MGGSAEKVLTYGGVTKPLWNSVGMFEDKKKKKGDGLSPQQRKNKAAKSAAPLLQQTALSPDDKPAGAGTALL